MIMILCAALRTLIVSITLFVVNMPHLLKAQVIDSRAITTSNFTFVTNRFTILKTETVISLDSVLRPQTQTRFQQMSDTPVVFHKYDPYYNWFRFIVANPDSFQKEVMLCMGPIGMKEAELYQKFGGNWISVGKTGKMIPFHQRPYMYAHFVYPLQLSPKALDTFYLHVDNRHYFKIYAFALLHPKALKVFQNRVYFLFGIIVGLLILFCLFNLYLYLSTKEKVHLWYAVYIVTSILFVLKNDSLDEEFIGFDTPATYRFLSVAFFGAFSIGILTHVIQVFFANIKKESWLYRITRLVKWNLFLSAMVHAVVFYIQPDALTEQIAVKWTLYSITLANVLIVCNCIYSIITGYRAGYFILGGLAVFLVGAFKRLLLLPDESYLKPPYIFHIGIICETMIVSFGLIYRTNLERKERKKYLEEKEVLEQSFEKKLLESRVEIQEQTLKSVSENLKKNIGKIVEATQGKLKMAKTAGFDDEEKVAGAEELLAKAVVDIENISKSFLSDAIAEQGLLSSIQYELELIRKTGKYRVHFVSQGDPFRLDAQREFILFRIFQESINNIIRHAKASRISVQLDFLPSLITISIKDDGIGFADAKLFQNTLGDYGSGIRNMKNRARSIGADFTIENNGDNGAGIIVSVPL